MQEAAAVVQEAALEAAAVMEEAAAMEAAVEEAAAVVELAAVEAGDAVEIRSKSPERVVRGTAKPVVRSKSPDFKLQEQGGQLEQGKQGQRENNPQVLQSALCSCCC